MSDSEHDVEVSPADVRALQILSFALCMGPVLFLGVVAFLHVTQPAPAKEPGEEAARLIAILSAAHGFIALNGLGMGAFLFNLRFWKSAKPGDDPADGMGELRAGTILRTALLEGPALFGAVVCFLANQNGVLTDHPEVWANGLSTGLLVALTVIWFPTERGIKSMLWERVQRAK